MAVGFLWVMLQLWWLLWFIWQQRRTKNMSPGSMPYVSLKVNIYNMGVSVHFIFFSAGNQVDFWPTKGNTTEPASYLIPITCNLILCCLHHYRKERSKCCISVSVVIGSVSWPCSLRVSAPVKLTPSSSVSWMARRPNADRSGRPESKPNSTSPFVSSERWNRVLCAREHCQRNIIR